MIIYIVTNKLKRNNTTIVIIWVGTFVCSIVYAVTKIDVKSIQ